MSFIKSIESIMTGQKTPSRLMHLLLTSLSNGYGFAIHLRDYLYTSGLLRIRKLPCYVISIGNITVGGTGKTPMTIHVARMVQQMGFRVAVISRGYRGSAETHGAIVSDGTQILLDVDTAGDEPLLMAESLTDIPVLVGSNRYQSGITAIRRFQTQVMVLDDAYQHLSLFRDLNLLLLDHEKPYGNGNLLPRGTLREKPTAIARSHAVIYTRTPLPFQTTDMRPRVCSQPVFYATHASSISSVITGNVRQNFAVVPMDLINGNCFFAFSGIARNEDFRYTLQEMNVKICGFRDFADHHDYTADDIHKIISEASSFGATSVVTTEKDFVRFRNRFHFPIPCLVIGIHITMIDTDGFDRFLQSRLKRYLDTMNKP
jgi:tetraacyldisaccharide 4'-kinase